MSTCEVGAHPGGNGQKAYTHNQFTKSSTQLDGMVRIFGFAMFSLYETQRNKHWGTMINLGHFWMPRYQRAVSQTGILFVCQLLTSVRDKSLVSAEEIPYWGYLSLEFNVNEHNDTPSWMYASWHQYVRWAGLSICCFEDTRTSQLVMCELWWDFSYSFWSTPIQHIASHCDDMRWLCTSPNGFKNLQGVGPGLLKLRLPCCSLFLWNLLLGASTVLCSQRWDSGWYLTGA